MLRSPFQRFAIALPVFVALIVALVFYPLYREAESLIREGVHAAIEQELLSLDDHLHDRGMAALAREIDERVASPVDPDAVYLLEGADRQRLAGNLEHWPAELAVADDTWFLVRDEAGHNIEGKVFVLFGGERMLVGRRSPLAHFRASMSARLLWSAALIVLGSALCTVLFMRYLHRRLGRLADDADAIHRGHLSRRLQARPDGDELDLLATRFNAAFDEIERLLDATRNVSSALAHDMRRPLIALRQHLDEALASAPPGDPLAQRLAPLSSQTDRLLKTFSALLRMARLESGTWTRPDGDCAFDEVVADAVELHRALAEAGGRSIAMRTQPARITGDRQLLSQLVCNLLENALAHGAGEIEIEAQRSGAKLRLSVRDHGDGVPAAALERIFERFYRIDASRGSGEHSGVGLALVRAVAHFHGGTARAEAARPGLRIVVELPLADARPGDQGDGVDPDFRPEHPARRLVS